MANEEDLLAKIGVTSEELVGYLYGGLFVAICAALVDNARVKSIVEALGDFVSAIAVLGLGVGVYVLYRRIIGEMVLYHVHHMCHRVVDFVAGREKENLTSSTAFLGYLAVPLGRRRAAYSAVRETFFDTNTKRRIDLAHGELHVLYITAVGSVAAYLYLRLSTPGRISLAWLVISIVSYLGALVGDIKEHSFETHVLKMIERTRLEKFLLDGGYLRKPATLSG